MARKKLRYEWDQAAREFLGPSLEGEPRGLREAVTLINSDITNNSGIRWKPPILFMIFVILTCVCGYTASYLSITNQKYGLGMVFLIATPVLAFCIFVVRSLRPNRYTRISNFMRVKSFDYQSIASGEGFHFDYLLVDSISTRLPDRQKAGTQRSKKTKCETLLRIDPIELFLEYSEAKPSTKSRIKVAVKVDDKKSGISIKRVQFEDLLQKRDTKQTSEEQGEMERASEQRGLLNMDSDLSARQSLTLEEPPNETLPPILPLKLHVNSEAMLSKRKPVFKEPDEEFTPSQTESKCNILSNSVEGIEAELPVLKKYDPLIHLEMK